MFTATEGLDSNIVSDWKRSSRSSRSNPGYFVDFHNTEDQSNKRTVHLVKPQLSRALTCLDITGLAPSRLTEFQKYLKATNAFSLTKRAVVTLREFE